MSNKQFGFAVIMFYLLLAFPSFYFVYKFADPIDVGHDFFQYYRLYDTWDWKNVNAPFNMRLISSGFIYLFHKTGFYYESATIFDKYLVYGFDKRVFFSAVFFNYVCVAATAAVIFYTVKQLAGQSLVALLAGTIFLLGSGIQFHQIMPCADAFSTLLFALVFYYYQKQSRISLLILPLAVFQREYVLLAFILIAGIDWFQTKHVMAIKTTLLALLCFAMYFVLRRTFFYTPALSFQTSPSQLIHALVNDIPPLGPYFRQLLLTLNLFLIYLGMVAYKKYRAFPLNKNGLIKIMLLLAQIILISFAALLGTNTGRYFFIASPLLLFYLASEAQAVFGNHQEN